MNEPTTPEAGFGEQLGRRLAAQVADIDAPVGGLVDVRRRAAARRRRRRASMMATAAALLVAFVGVGVVIAERHDPPAVVDVGPDPNPDSTPATLVSPPSPTVAFGPEVSWWFRSWNLGGYQATVDDPDGTRPDVSVLIAPAGGVEVPVGAEAITTAGIDYQVGTARDGRPTVTWSPEPGVEALVTTTPLGWDDTTQATERLFAVAAQLRPNRDALRAKLLASVGTSDVWMVGGQRQWLQQLTGGAGVDASEAAPLSAANLAVWSSAGWGHMWLSSSPSRGPEPEGRVLSAGARVVTVADGPQGEGVRMAQWFEDDHRLMVTYDTTTVSDDEALAIIAVLRHPDPAELDEILFATWRPDGPTMPGTTVATTVPPSATTVANPAPPIPEWRRTLLAPTAPGWDWSVSTWADDGYALDLRPTGPTDSLRTSLVVRPGVDNLIDLPPAGEGTDELVVDGPSGPIRITTTIGDGFAATWNPTPDTTAVLVSRPAGADPVGTLTSLAWSVRPVDTATRAAALRALAGPEDLWVVGTPGVVTATVAVDVRRDIGAARPTVTTAFATSAGWGHLTLASVAGAAPLGQPTSTVRLTHPGFPERNVAIRRNPNGVHLADWTEDGRVLRLTFDDTVTDDDVTSVIGALRHPTDAELSALFDATRS